MGVFMIFRTCIPLFFSWLFYAFNFSKKKFMFWAACYASTPCPVHAPRVGVGGGDLQPLWLFLCSSIKPCSVHLACQLSGLSLSECLK